MKCKAAALLTAYLFMAAFALWPEDVITYLNAGAPLAIGPVDSAVMMRDSANVLYFISVSGGTISARKSIDGGGSFTATSISFGSRTLTNVRDLSLLSRVFQTPLAFFIADDAFGSGIYALYLDPVGNLSLYCDGRLDDDSVGAVTEFTALPEAPERFVVFYNKSGVLRYSWVSTSAGVPALWNGPISGDTEPVIAFQVQERYLPLHEAFVGTYETTDAGQSRLFAFFLTDNALTRVDQLDTTETDGPSLTTLLVMRDGALQANWITGQRISIKTYTGSGWTTKLSRTATFRLGACLPVTNGQALIDAVVGESVPRFLYGDISSSAGLSVPLYPIPVIGMPGGVALPSSFLLTALLDDPAGRKIATKRYSFGTSTWDDCSPLQIADAAILDAWFSSPVLARFAAVLNQRMDGTSVTVFEFDEATTAYQPVQEVRTPEASNLLAWLISSDLLYLEAGQSHVLVDLATDMTEALPIAGQVRQVQSDDGVLRLLIGDESGWQIAARRM